MRATEAKQGKELGIEINMVFHSIDLRSLKNVG